MVLLLRAVRQQTRDTMREARIAGLCEAYENGLPDLTAFARKALEEAKQ